MIKFIHNRSDMAVTVAKDTNEYVQMMKSSDWRLVETVKKPIAKPTIEQTPAKTNDVESKDTEMSYNELKAVAKEKGIKGYSRMKKEELIIAVEESNIVNESDKDLEDDELPEDEDK